MCGHYGRKLCGDASCVNKETSYSCFCPKENDDLVKDSLCLTRMAKKREEHKQGGRNKLILPESPAVIVAATVLCAELIGFFIYIIVMDMFTAVTAFYRYILTEPDDSDDETDGSQRHSRTKEIGYTFSPFESSVSLEEESVTWNKSFVENKLSLFGPPCKKSPIKSSLFGVSFGKSPINPSLFGIASKRSFKPREKSLEIESVDKM